MYLYRLQIKWDYKKIIFIETQGMPQNIAIFFLLLNHQQHIRILKEMN
jgi:hypothetical protein